MQFKKVVFLGWTVVSTYCFAEDYPESFMNARLAEMQKPVELDVRRAEVGQLVRLFYMGEPVGVYFRTNEDMVYLESPEAQARFEQSKAYSPKAIEQAYFVSIAKPAVQDQLIDQPNLDKELFRSKNKKYFVMRLLNPETGCHFTVMPPEFSNKVGSLFLDPCNGAWLDVAGRPMSGQETGAAIPAHHWKDENNLIIGEIKPEQLSELPDIESQYANKSIDEQLLLAATFNDFDRVKALVKQGANVNATSERDFNVLSRAIVGSSTAMVRFLLESGSNIKPNHLKAAEGLKREDVQELLVEFAKKP